MTHRRAPAAIGAAACTLAALAWASVLRRGWYVGWMSYEYTRFPGSDPNYGPLAVIVVLPLAVIPGSIVVAAAGLLWEQRWAAPFAVATAVAASVHVATVVLTSRALLGIPGF